MQDKFIEALETAARKAIEIMNEILDIAKGAVMSFVTLVALMAAIVIVIALVTVVITYWADHPATLVLCLFIICVLGADSRIEK